MLLSKCAISSSITPADIGNYCFEAMKGEDGDEWKCKFCSRIIKCLRKKHGPRNLVSHTTTKHQEDYKDFIMEIKAGESKGITQQKIVISSIDKKLANIYAWMDLITELDMPFSWAENQNFLQYSKLIGVDIKTLKKYLIKMGSAVDPPTPIY